MAPVTSVAALLLCSRAALVAAGALRGEAANATASAPLLGNASGSVEEAMAAAELSGDVSAAVVEELEAAAAELSGNVSALAARGGRWSGGRRRRQVMTLYHTTSPEVAELILASEFKPGRGGWCGGAIYFVDTPTLPRTKYSIHTLDGAVIEAKVDMGHMALMDSKCDASYGHGLASARRHGYDSIRFDPGDGDEFVIHSASRVRSMRLYK